MLALVQTESVLTACNRKLRIFSTFKAASQCSLPFRLFLLVMLDFWLHKVQYV